VSNLNGKKRRTGEKSLNWTDITDLEYFILHVNLSIPINGGNILAFRSQVRMSLLCN
jgi:hypothetical protein